MAPFVIEESPGQVPCKPRFCQRRSDHGTQRRRSAGWDLAPPALARRTAIPSAVRACRWLTTRSPIRSSRRISFPSSPSCSLGRGMRLLCHQLFDVRLITSRGTVQHFWIGNSRAKHAGLVHQVNRFVRQVHIGDVAGGQANGSLDGFGAVLDLMEVFVSSLQTEEDFYGLSYRRLRYINSLAAPHDCFIFAQLGTYSCQVVAPMIESFPWRSSL